MERSRCLALVDDSADDVAFVRRALAASYPAADLLTFRSGSEAVARLMEERTGPRVDLVLLDMKLPGLGGHAILTALRQRFSQGELPVVIFTSSRESSDLKRAYAAGANSYVVKPLVYEEYAALVGRVVHYWLEVNSSLEAEGAGDA